MDDLVRQALAKWPNVPDCIGWLALDARGRWRVGAVEDGPRQPITHAAMNAFINRNYFALGRHWIFQNGPQRVFVDLEYTPYVWRLSPGPDGGQSLATHTGVVAEPSGLWLDDAGRFVIQARPMTGDPIVGVLHDHDTALLAAQLCDPDGEELDDDAMTALSEDDTSVLQSVRWPWKGRTGRLVLPLQRIAAEDVPLRFHFEPRPSISVKADLDVRR